MSQLSLANSSSGLAARQPSRCPPCFRYPPRAWPIGTPSCFNRVTKRGSLVARSQAQSPYPASSQIFMGPIFRCSWSSSTASSLRCTVVQRGSLRLFLLLSTHMNSIPPGNKAVVRALVIFALQMHVGFHGCDNAGMPQPLLNEFPIHWLTFAQIGANELSRVGMAELMGMQPDAGSLRVVLKHALHSSHREGCSTGDLPLTIPRMLVENDPEMISARGRFNPDLRHVEVQESHEGWREMNEAVSPISRLGTRSVLIICAKSYMHPMLAKIEVL